MFSYNLKYKQNITHNEIVEAEKVRPNRMYGLLGLPMFMKERSDVIRSEVVDGERVWRCPRIVSILKGYCRRHRRILAKLGRHRYRNRAGIL